MDNLDVLVVDARFDVCSDNVGDPSDPALRFIHRAALPGGGCIPLFKVLQTNVCTNDCGYCANQVGRDCPRASLRPEQLAKTFMELHAKRLVRGLFLTSGIAGSATRTMESMIETVEILRYRYEFDGYVHLKILPGASFDCVEAGCRLADRVSINMEAPTTQHLARLSSKKDLLGDIVERMRWVKRLKANNERLVPSGQTTQFVVGAAGETDRDLLQTTVALYQEMNLRRVYFSAFRPIEGTTLEELRPTSPLREHRLYQADWLFRVYGFSLPELEVALEGSDDLPLGKDPKLVIAQKQPWLYPVDINRASYAELLRVPGIGPVSAKRIVEARREHSVFSLEQLRKMRVPSKRALPFIWFQGMLPSERHMSFLPELDDALEEPQPLAAALASL